MGYISFWEFIFKGKREGGKARFPGRGGGGVWGSFSFLRFFLSFFNFVS